MVGIGHWTHQLKPGWSFPPDWALTMVQIFSNYPKSLTACAKHVLWLERQQNRVTSGNKFHFRTFIILFTFPSFTFAPREFEQPGFVGAIWTGIGHYNTVMSSNLTYILFKMPDPQAGYSNQLLLYWTVIFPEIIVATHQKWITNMQ